MPELHDLADELGVAEHDAMTRQDLIFRVEQRMLDESVVLVGEGVLEVLPEGYGFLRSQDWNYLYSPDDIYVSPSQIKRFELKHRRQHLRPGASAQGVGALPRAAQGGDGERRRARGGEDAHPVRQPAPALSRCGACGSRRRTATSRCA